MKQLLRDVLPPETYRSMSRVKNGLMSGHVHRKLMVKRGMGERYLGVRVDTVSACNHRCQYCYTLDLTGHRTQLMPLESFEKVAKNLFPYAHTLALSCTWEPTMNKRLADFIRAAGDFGVPYKHFVTNGSYLTEEMMAAAIETGIDRIAVSIDAATPELYKEIRESDDLEMVLANLRRFQEMKRARGVKKPVININWTAFEENADQAVQFVKQNDDVFDTFWFWHLLPKMRNEVIAYHRMDKKRYYGVVARLKELLGPRLTSSEYNEDQSNKPLGICNRSLENLTVHPEGRIQVGCSKHYLEGNVIEQDFSEIFEMNEALFEQLFHKETEFCQTDCGR